VQKKFLTGMALDAKKEGGRTDGARFLVTG
jgi:hypothetical protein